MNSIKYIVVRAGILNRFGEEAVVFSGTVQHSHIAARMGLSVENGDVLGAGFVNIGVVEGEVAVGVYGNSTSLGISSREEDLVLVKYALLE